MIDQAGKLREMVNGRINIEHNDDDTHHVKIYSVVSGKGGVGKTNFSINLAIKLRQMGKRVLVLDADIGMSNANILLGIETPLNIFSMLEGKASLNEIIATGPENVDLVSGGSDLFYIESLDHENQQQIIRALSDLGAYDVIIIDNGAGISKHSLTFTTFAHEVILITTPEPTALTDAYRVLKAISIYKLKKKVKVVVNQIQDMASGEEAYNKLLITSKRFLGLSIENLGFIFNDIRVNKAIMEQKPIVLMYPNAMASMNISQISRNILDDKNFNCNVSSIKQLSNRLIKFFG